MRWRIGLFRLRMLGLRINRAAIACCDISCTSFQTLVHSKEKLLPADAVAQDEQLLRRVHACLITLNLYDVDGFILRRIDVPLMQGVDDNAKLSSLDANESVQMDANEYRSLLGNSKASGSWNVSWACLTK
jgi:hypothetical protein